MQRAEDGAERFLGELLRQRDHHIVQRRQLGEQPQILKGPRDPGMHDRLRPQPVERPAAKRHLPLVGPQEAGDGIEDRRLARAVRSHQAGDAALLDLETAIPQRVQTAETMVQARRPADTPRHSRSPSKPCGRNSMKAISSTP